MNRLDHFSPSNLNLWMDSPHLWCARYLKHVRDSAGIPALVGQIIEAGCGAWLDTGDVRDVEAATVEEINSYRELFVLDDAHHEAVISFINDTVETFCATRKPAPGVIFQKRIEVRVPGVRRPIIGFIDFLTETGGIELKTKGCPKEGDAADKKVFLPAKAPDVAHRRQAALYSHSEGVPFSIAYYSGKRSPRVFTLTDEDVAQGMKELTDAARAIELFLDSTASDDELIASLGPLQIDGKNFFRWGEETLWAVLSAKKRVEEVAA